MARRVTVADSPPFAYISPTQAQEPSQCLGPLASP